MLEIKQKMPTFRQLFLLLVFIALLTLVSTFAGFSLVLVVSITDYFLTNFLIFGLVFLEVGIKFENI